MEVGNRAGSLTLGSAGEASVVVEERVSGVEFDRLVVVAERGVQIAQVRVRVAPAVVGAGVLRVELNCLVVVLECGVQLAQTVVGVAPVEVGAGKFGIELDSLVAVLDRASRSLLFPRTTARMK